MNATKSKASWPKVTDILKQFNKVLLCCHDEMDDDAMCAVVAISLVLESLNVQFEFGYHGQVPNHVHLLERDISLKEFTRQPPNLADINAIIVLDTAEVTLMARAANLLHDLQARGVPVVNIDHHPTNQMYGDINIVDPWASAVCELLYYWFRDSGIDISADMAHCLLWGILRDTVMLKASSVTSRTCRSVADLMDLGADRTGLVEQLPDVPNVTIARLWGSILSNIITSGRENNIAYAVVDHNLVESARMHGKLDGITSFMRDIGGVDVAILFTERVGHEVKVSFRSKSRIDVGKIAGSLGGGGHHSSSACIIRGKSLEEAVEFVVGTVQVAVQEQQLSANTQRRDSESRTND